MFVFFVLLYIYLIVSSRESKCDSIRGKTEYIIDYSDLSGVILKNIVLKSAFNCCCIGGMKNDYVDLCALTNCSKKGVRVLDFQIFSLNNYPIVSASTVNQNEYKELYNYLSFSEVISKVNQEFLVSDKDQNTHVLFLNFRIQSNNIDIYDQMATTLLDNLSGSTRTILKRTDTKELHQYTIPELDYKIIIMVDLTNSPKMKSSFIKTKLNNLTMVVFGDGFQYHSIHENDAYLQSGVEMAALYPTKTAYSNNYDFQIKGVDNHFNFIFMNFQTKGAYLDNYMEYFKDNNYVSFINAYSDISFDYII